MTPAMRLTLLARGPVSPTPGTKKPIPKPKLSPQNIERWKRRSQKSRADYLKQHPNSAYKKIRVNTPSERVSKDPNNQAVRSGITETLKDMGFKAKTSLKDTVAHFSEFLGAANRTSFAEKGTAVAVKILRRIKGADRQQIRDDAKAIISDPRRKPSAILAGRNTKMQLATLVGVGVCAAMFGTGLVTPSFVAFAGAKAIDYGIQRVRQSLAATSIDEFFLAATIGNFVQSKDGGGFFSNLKDAFKKSFGMKHGSDDEHDNDPAIQSAFEKLGIKDYGSPKTIRDKYEALTKQYDPEQNGGDSSKLKELRQLKSAMKTLDEGGYLEDDKFSEKKDSEDDNGDTGNADDGGDTGDAPSDKESDAEPEDAVDEDVPLQRPSPARLEAVKAAFEKAGVQASVSAKTTEPGQLQRPVEIKFDKGVAPNAMQQALRSAGIIETRSMKPFGLKDIAGKTSLTGYLTK